MKNRCLVVLIAAILILTGCTSKDVGTEPATLWVVTEKTVADGMNYQVESVVSQFSNDYPNITVRVDYLPTDPTEREQYVQELNAGFAEGTAPDVYLLPTKRVLVLDEPTQYSYVPIDPLFPDVTSEMHDGRFYDISKFYNKDKDLNKESLVDAAMEAGTIDQHRYIIPLRFTMPVVYMTGEDARSIESARIDDLMNSAINENDSALARGIINYGSINLFSNVVDHSKKQITLTQEQLADYLSIYRQLDAIPDSRSMNSRPSFSNIEGLIEECAIRINTLESYLVYHPYTQYKKIPLQIKALESMDGDTIATIKYWGAVDAACNNPQIAYDFLSRFLSEEFQWELNRSAPAENQYPGLVEEGWPVLARDAAEHLWPNIRAQLTAFNPYYSIEFDESVIAKLYDSIDFVRFISENDFGTLQNDACNAANENEQEVLAENYLNNLAKQYPNYIRIPGE